MTGLEIRNMHSVHLCNVHMSSSKECINIFTWLMSCRWPVMRVRGLALEEGSHRNMVKSSDPDASRSALPPHAASYLDRHQWHTRLKRADRVLMRWASAQPIAAGAPVTCCHRIGAPACRAAFCYCF